MQIRTLKYRPGSADRIVLIPFLVDKLGDESRGLDATFTNY
jgi:hypothetical protein